MSMPPDFLRQIVNPRLAEAAKKNKSVVSIIDEARKLMAKAESKYHFSVYGGSPEKLLDYLNSGDFDLLINVFKSGNAIDVLVEILDEAREAYGSIPGLAEAIESKIKEIRNRIVRGVSSGG